MEEAFIQNATAYASQRQLRLAERLGFGIHGIIYVAEGKSAGGKTAVKAHREAEPFRRELSVYLRLQEAQKRDQFDARWPKVQAVLAELEELDIHMVDVSPSNIAFLD